MTYDQKTGLSYVGKRKAKIEDSKDYYGSGTIIQRIIKKRGAYFLKKIILGVCYSLQELKNCETECKFFFNLFDKKYGYNIAINDWGGDTFTHNPNKEKARINMSKGQKGRKHTKKTCNKISKSNTGKSKSKEHRENISKSLQGYKSSRKGKTNKEYFGEERAKELSQIYSKANKGRICKESTRKKLSETSTGRTWSEERCECFSKRLKEDYKLGKRKTVKGRKQSEEHKRKRSESIKRHDLDNKINEMILLRKQGLFYKEIAKIFGCSETFVIHRIKRK